MHVQSSRFAVCLLAFGTLAGAGQADATDRHVYLDTNGDGQLNDCPNPAHNAKGTSNTDELWYCSGGTQSGRVLGTTAGHTSASLCTAGGGTVAPVRNGTLADVDGDGIAEPIYAHPQACVWNMAKSDSCEVHAGTYRRPGAQCTSNCGDFSRAGVPQGTCADWNCYLASVLAFGYGPNLDGTGYGTKSSPGYLRGAVMNGSIDTWDADGDKIPDAREGMTSYPAILSGDANGNGAFDLTSCTGSSCSGDMFFAIQIGCGADGNSSYGINCSNAFSGTETGPQIDTNGDGTFDTEIGRQGSREVDWLVVKDIEFSGYNGGNGSANQTARYKEGMINLNGDGSTNGLALDHVAVFGNDYKYPAGASETFWAIVGDLKNNGCTDPHYSETKNSYLEQNNQLIFDNDGQVGSQLGCPFWVHDNRIVVNVTSPRSGQGNSVDAPANAIFYLKSVDTLADGSPHVDRFWNNEVVYVNGGPQATGHNWFIDLQAFGNANGHGLGEMWVYGNLFRNDPAVANPLQMFFPMYCSYPSNDVNWRFYYFNNTWDGWSASTAVNLRAVCNNSSQGELYVGINNAEIYTSSEQATTNVVTRRVSNNVATDSSRCSSYFDCGSNPTVWSGLSYYRPKAGGGLDGTGSCDPDGDGVPGVDYNGDGVNDLSWTDLAGNLVSCPSLSSRIDIGAIQAGNGPPPDTTPPGTPANLRRTDTR